MQLTTVISAPRRQCHKRTLFVATGMLIFSAFKRSKIEVCCYTISRLWLFQAVLLLAQHYTIHLTTVITAPRRQCHKRTLFVATDMLISGAFKCSENEVYCYTISRLWLFQAVLLLAQHYTMHSTTVIAAMECHNRRGTQFLSNAAAAGWRMPDQCVCYVRSTRFRAPLIRSSKALHSCLSSLHATTLYAYSEQTATCAHVYCKAPQITAFCFAIIYVHLEVLLQPSEQFIVGQAQQVQRLLQLKTPVVSACSALGLQQCQCSS
jgi:hypothetical protein